jgi:hypothetical protein
MSQPTAIDLFSGAGGASLGLADAGFGLRLAADFDPCLRADARGELESSSSVASGMSMRTRC